MRAVFLIALLPSLAVAGWRHVGSVTGTPTDVVVADAGVVLVTTSTQAVAFGRDADGGFSTIASITGSSYAGAAFFDDCFSAGTSGGQIAFSAGCGSPVSVSASPITAYRAMPGRGVALTTSATNQFSSTTDIHGTWAPQAGNVSQAASARSFGFARIGGVDVAVMTSTGGVRKSIGGAAVTPVSGVSSSIDVWPFELDATPALFSVTSLGELQLVRDINAPSVESLPLPPGVTPRRVAAFGLQGMLSSDAGVVCSPIPDPAHAGEGWVARSNAPLLNDRIFCLDANWCAGVTNDGEVWVYENASAPVVDVASSVTGGVAQFIADAGDEDGDPLFISWSTGAGTMNADGGVATMSLDGECSASVEVTVRDSNSLTNQSVQVVSTERGQFDLQGAAAAIAGGAAVNFSAAIDGGCVGAELSWSDSLGGSGSGASYTFTPPATWCAPGTPVTITATANWDSGVPATTQLQRQLTIVPWGAPEAPVFASPGTQDGGAQVWSPINAAHVCESASGFPGTELLWNIDAGAATVIIVDGGLLISSMGACIATHVSATARRQVLGEQNGRVSAPGSLEVEVVPDLQPLGASTPFSFTVDAGAGLASGTIEVSASCLDQRELTAELSLDTGAQGTFAAPGDWALTIPGGCTGGTWNVTARLLEHGVFTGAQAQRTVTTEATPVAVGQLDVTTLNASCGAGVTRQVVLQPVDGTCLSADVSWRALSGPPLEMSTGTGATVSLQTAAHDLSVVGQTIELEFTVSSGAGNSMTQTRSLPISIEPFVTATTRLEPPLAQLEDGRTYVFTLTSALACEVSGLTVKLPLRRVDATSVLIDGQHVEAGVSANELELGAVTLGSNPVEIRVQGSGVLLGGDVPQASVWLNGVRVSQDPEVAAPKKCGCSSLDGAVIGFWWLVLMFRRRNAQTK